MVDIYVEATLKCGIETKLEWFVTELRLNDLNRQHSRVVTLAVMKGSSSHKGCRKDLCASPLVRNHLSLRSREWIKFRTRRA